MPLIRTVCGSEGAYRRHLRNDETPCAECKAGHAKYRIGARERNRKYKARHPDRVKADRVQWNDRNHDKKRDYHLKKYGLTRATFDAILLKQGGLCAICRKKPLPGSRWHVDHDHSVGPTAIRGILCGKCNLTLGRMGDSLDGVRAWTTEAISYLIDHQLRSEIDE